MSEGEKPAKKQENMKTVFQQINLENVVFEKRERKQVNQQIVLASVAKQPKRIYDPQIQKKPGKKKKDPIPFTSQEQAENASPIVMPRNLEEEVPANTKTTLQSMQPIVPNAQIIGFQQFESDSSSFDPKTKSKKQAGKKYRRTNKFKQVEAEDSSEEEDYKRRLILKRVNKIFKKSYEQKQILSTGSEQELLVKALFRNMYEKVFQDIPVPSSEITQLSNIVKEQAVEQTTLSQTGDDKQEDKMEEDNQVKVAQVAVVEKRILNEDGTDLETKRNLKLLGIENLQYYSKLGEVKTYINCDLRYFNLDYLVEKVGNFDVVLMDPPWRIKGGQQNDSSFMFTNSKFSLDYNTMSNQEIMDIKIEKLSKKGFLFLWILNTQLNIAYEMASKWGYEIVDQIIWVKLNAQGNNVYLSTGYYFMHSFEICLVGYKCPPGEHVEYHSKISNNVMFSPVRNKSQKPIELYELIELMMPGAKKIELFARNHNLRHGWLSIGNQLGETYQKWQVQINCNICNNPLQPGISRFKSKKLANFDICLNCYSNKISNGELAECDFFNLANKADEEVLHQYHQCNMCQQQPIWGTRFECVTCDNYDLCEACFDLHLQESASPHLDHGFRVVELPIFAEGIPCHDSKCNGCFQKPILGVQFTCKQCANFNLCQNCFFSRTAQELSGPRHKPDHRLEPIYEPQIQGKRQYKCQGCEIDVAGPVYKCENCFGFYFCEQCYALKKDDWKCYVATSHKNYHTFIKI